MKIKIRFFASYREITRLREKDYDIEDGTTAYDLLQNLIQEYPQLASIASNILYAINGEYMPPHTELRAGDEVVFVPPMSGGESRFTIVEGEIAPETLIREVIDDGVGAVVTFVGTVRGFSKGKKVVYLEYEAYKEMAEKKLAEIGREIKARWGLDRVAITHRVGHLNIGDISVVIAVAAPHRQEAFEACQYAIDDLKKTVPIWKKEVWEDGETWVGLEE